MAPHGTLDGLLGLPHWFRSVQLCPPTTSPLNINGQSGMEVRYRRGPADPIVVDSHVAVLERPGIGVDFRVEEPRNTYLKG